MTIPDEVRKIALAMKKDGYRGPLNWATKVIDFVADYTTPPAAPAKEPVAWIEHEWSGSGLRHLHFERREQSVRDEVMNPIWTPLYTPLAAPVPLTEAQIKEGWRKMPIQVQMGWSAYLYGARFAEAAHGITKGQP